MPDFEVALDDDEDIVRIFHRYPTELWAFSKLRAKDFARQMEDHSGITLLRLKYLNHDRHKALDWLKTHKLKGLAICKAVDLKALGLRFMACADDHPHLSTRCRECNLAVNYEKGVCVPLDGLQCSINLKAEVTLSKVLYKRFKVDTPIPKEKADSPS